MSEIVGAIVSDIVEDTENVAVRESDKVGVFCDTDSVMGRDKVGGLEKVPVSVSDTVSVGGRVFEAVGGTVLDSVRDCDPEAV